MKCKRLIKRGIKPTLCGGNLKSLVCIDTETDASGAIRYVNLITNIKCDKCRLPCHDLTDVLEKIIDKYIEEL